MGPGLRSLLCDPIECLVPPAPPAHSVRLIEAPQPAHAPGPNHESQVLPPPYAAARPAAATMSDLPTRRLFGGRHPSPVRRAPGRSCQAEGRGKDIPPAGRAGDQRGADDGLSRSQKFFIFLNQQTSCANHMSCRVGGHPITPAGRSGAARREYRARHGLG
jgi:hypothetical protein